MTSSDKLTPKEAAKLIKRCAELGLDINSLAQILGVTPLYASRLGKDSYWPSGFIPRKTARELHKIIEDLSPETTTGRVAEISARLVSGDVYFIHSARPILEFHDKNVRRLMLECIGRGVSVHYMFPNLDRLFSDYEAALLELTELISSDLRTRYRLLMKAFLMEAQETGLCSEDQLRRQVTFKEHGNGFLFSPWNKLIYIESRSDAGVECTVIQEHHSIDSKARPIDNSVDWVVHAHEAAIIGRILKSAKSEVLSW